MPANSVYFSQCDTLSQKLKENARFSSHFVVSGNRTITLAKNLQVVSSVCMLMLDKSDGKETWSRRNWFKKNNNTENYMNREEKNTEVLRDVGVTRSLFRTTKEKQMNLCGISIVDVKWKEKLYVGKY